MTSPAPAGYQEIRHVLTHLGLIVKETRRARHLSLRAAAKQIRDGDPATIKRLEDGAGGTRLATVLNVLEWLDQP